MKKIVACFMMTAFIFGAVSCARQDGDTAETAAYKHYCYEKDGFGGDFTISIGDDGNFSYYVGPLSSYIGYGQWTLDDGVLVITDAVENYPCVNRFKVDGDSLVFIAEGSSNFMFVTVADGERFDLIEIDEA